MSFETLENEILQILKSNHASRQDDMYLYACYVFDKTKDDGMGRNWLLTIFNDRKYRITHGIAPYNSVSRVRRKLQEKYPELRPSPEVIKQRKESEKEYKAYARGKK